MIANKKLYDEVFKIIVNSFECEHIFVDNESIDRRLTDWYNHTDYTEPETLAALTMYSEYNPFITYQDVKEIKEFFFPSIPSFEIHISEIEAALHDYDYLFEERV